ncbi:hypothetical protein [Acidipropionibacterium jensenii]|uniref:hypothetical protein n=1 Tax=Acidipropionibacterium jensenii TaxID=1749 RepID=UPI00264956FA|nr:hypothetical protein [Acidipropionibacterium jensenii]MDN6428587.1 hypothetical protein [Propionibacterium sp.]MDN6442397.1 hypothetical protein [Acidipropionibacterium jensenii]MDN6481201.1 hypothetical protein [Acidipropionibacterium jensenii]MDN6513480.1 hypothetical protein [Acidipropionibacterium jensenii]MDN6592782.1 hypothetical protein [Acidipropionibacterium jensenii]
MPSKRPPIIYRPGPEMQEWLEAREALRDQDRASISIAARDELAMFRALAELELERETWTADELAILSDTLAGLAPDLTPAIPGPVYGAVWARPDRERPEVAELLEHLGRISPSADKQLSYAITAHQARRLDDDRQGWAKVGVRLR